MNAELQRALDMLAAMQMQRDNALNNMVHAQAELASRDREIASLRSENAALRQQLPPQTPAPHELNPNENILCNGAAA